MSGGVDSSMAMYLLKKQGYEPIGVSLKYEVWDDPANSLKENVCCSDESFKIAKHVCEKLDAKHYILDVGKKFKKEIVEYFKAELRAKRTPNPCVICNRVLKFKELFAFAKKHGAKFVATGHYARIVKNVSASAKLSVSTSSSSCAEKVLPGEKKGDNSSVCQGQREAQPQSQSQSQLQLRPISREFELHRSADPKKDQTYTLSFLKKEWLPKILFPLGGYTKDEVLKMAEKAGFGFYLYRKQSQDFCYVSDKSMKAFLEKEIGIESGKIVDTHGKVLGRHKGLHFYTIGQRKGVEIPNGPWFVVGMNVGKNELVVTKPDTRTACPSGGETLSKTGTISKAGTLLEAATLFKKELILSPYNLLIKPFKKPIRVEAKIRYGQEASKATLLPSTHPSPSLRAPSLQPHIPLRHRESLLSSSTHASILSQNTLKLIFDTPQRAVTPGQFAVFYQGKKCLGSGRIMQTN